MATLMVKFEGNSTWTLRNRGGNAVFYFLDALREEGFTRRLATGEGPHGTYGSVKTDQLDELRRRMRAADITEIRGDGVPVAAQQGAAQ